MRKINAPAIVFLNVYNDCINTINKARKSHFENIRVNIDALASNYVLNAQTQKLHTIPTDSGYPPLKSNDFKYLYTGKMVKKGEGGRKYYDKLMLASPNQICPYCDFMPVDQLDHVMAKAHYSTLSVLPANLVPACGACNFIKKDKIIKVESDLHLHPYFDNEKNEQWLHAEIIPTPKSIMFNFYLKKLAGCNDFNDKVETHFKTFELKKRFEVIAAAAVLNMPELVTLYKENPLSLKKHLESVSRDLLDHKVNFWKTAMYCALRDSVWFCTGGVMNIKP